jgi:hypothetical protein
MDMWYIFPGRYLLVELGPGEVLSPEEHDREGNPKRPRVLRLPWLDQIVRLTLGINKSQSKMATYLPILV